MHSRWVFAWFLPLFLSFWEDQRPPIGHNRVPKLPYSVLRSVATFCTLVLGSTSIFFESFCLLLLSLLQPFLQKSLPRVCGWFVKLFGLVFDGFWCLSLPIVFLGAWNLFQKCEIAFSSCFFDRTVLSDFSFSLSFLGFFSSFYFVPWMINWL